jgi:DNA-directed RNA polymerase subunit F
MSESGPSLQEIYLNACRNFDEMANKLLQGFSAAVDSALLSYEDTEVVAREKASAVVTEQEREIILCLNKSLDAIRTSVEQTIDENDRFLEHVGEELILNCRTLQQEINDITEQLLRAHQLTAKSHAARLSGHCDKAVESVQQTSNRARQNLREQSNVVATQFGEALVEKQSQQFADLVTRESQARKEIPDLLADMISKARTHEDKLADLHRQHTEKIDDRIVEISKKVSDVAESEMARIVDTSSHTEDRLRITYDEMRTRLLGANEGYTKQYHDDLEATARDSRDTTAEFLVQLLDEMNRSANSISDDERRKANLNADRAMQLSDELLNLIEDQRVIAAQKSTVMAQILTEMKEIEANFEKRITKLSEDQSTRISQSCEVAVTEIAAARKSVSAKISHLSNLYMRQIEEEEARILKMIERRLEKAIQLIETAVGRD